MGVSLATSLRTSHTPASPVGVQAAMLSLSRGSEFWSFPTHWALSVKPVRELYSIPVPLCCCDLPVPRPGVKGEDPDRRGSRQRRDNAATPPQRALQPPGSPEARLGPFSAAVPWWGVGTGVSAGNLSTGQGQLGVEQGQKVGPRVDPVQEFEK